MAQRDPAYREVDDVVTVADLQRLHLHHLRHGPAGVAADVETLAAVRRMPVADLVAQIEDAAADDDTDLGGWASFVVDYVRQAVASGVLDLDR